MAKIRKKPIVVEAMQIPALPLSADGFVEWGRLGSWLGTEGKWRLVSGVGGDIEIDTLEGKMTAKPGDWIIRGVDGELYPIKHSILVKSYDILEP